MSDRASQLLETADNQISELTALLSGTDEAALRTPCPGREKLHDGTLAAAALHTADTYHRIAAFAGGEDPGADEPHPTHGHAQTTGATDREALLQRLASARHAVSAVDLLTNQQLDAVPPAGQARFCDGQRTLENVLTRMLKHQARQIDAIRAVIA